MAYTFLGHGSGGGTLEYKGKVYQAGESVPMTKADVEHHARHGVKFEGFEEAVVAADAMPQSPPDERPRDDRGAVIESKK